MRNGIKIKNGPVSTKETHHEVLFLPPRLFDGNRIALYEAGADARYLEVDPKSKKVLQDNSDFFAVNPLGLVPTISTDDGLVLTENAAILQYVADRFPDAGIGSGTGHRTQPVASVAVFHRHRTAQGAVPAAARQEGSG